jgi:hypothetical protein
MQLMIKTQSSLEVMENQTSRLVAGSPVHAEGAVRFLTIAIPTFQRPGLLLETLRSVAALEFDIPVEVIIVDNDPDGDDLAATALMDVLKGWSYSYYRNIRNVGMFGNWNQCLSLAQGKYVTVLHDDDLLVANFSRVANAVLKNNCLEREILGFHISILEQRQHRSTKTAPVMPAARPVAAVRCQAFSVAELFFSNRFCGTLGVIFNRDIALGLGGFKAAWYPIADYEFWCRWGVSVGPIPIMNECVALYRIGQNESIKLETRSAFVSKSRELRLHLLDNGAVPRIFRMLVPLLRFSQGVQIYKDWRTADEPPVPFLMRLLQFACVKVFALVPMLTRSSGAALQQRAKGGLQ